MWTTLISLFILPHRLLLFAEYTIDIFCYFWLFIDDIVTPLINAPLRQNGLTVVWRCIHFGGGDPGSLDIFAQHSQCWMQTALQIFYPIVRQKVSYTLTVLA